jgi:hypothetical protein
MIQTRIKQTSKPLVDRRTARPRDVTEMHHHLKMANIALRVLKKKPFVLAGCKVPDLDPNRAHRKERAHQDAPDGTLNPLWSTLMRALSQMRRSE